MPLIGDAMFEMFKDEKPEALELSQSDMEAQFAKYMKENSEMVYELADNAIQIGLRKQACLEILLIFLYTVLIVMVKAIP